MGKHCLLAGIFIPNYLADIIYVLIPLTKKLFLSHIFKIFTCLAIIKQLKYLALIKTHEIYFKLLINNTIEVIFTMFFLPETVVDSDDESGSSHESDYDPLTAMLVYTQQDRPILPPPGPQDLCTIGGLGPLS